MSTDTKSAFWQQHIENCSRSSLSQRQYCIRNLLALSTFTYWKRRLNKGKQQSQVRFYPLAVQSEPPRTSPSRPAGISIRLAQNDLQVDLAEDFSVPALMKLLTNLKQL